MAQSILADKPTIKEEKRRIPLQWLISLPLLLIAGAGFFLYLYLAPAPAGPTEQVYEPPPGLLHEGHPDFEWYRDYFRIQDVKGVVVFNFAGDRSVVINGLFDNRGERDVEAAEIRISFYDPQGELIRQRTASPLRPETGLKRPLNSLERRTFSVRFDDLPVNLQVGNLEVVLTGIRLAPKAQG